MTAPKVTELDSLKTEQFMNQHSNILAEPAPTTTQKMSEVHKSKPEPLVNKYSIPATKPVMVVSSEAAEFLKYHGNFLASATFHQWHQIIVKTPVTDRRAVIRAINRQIAPLKLTPYFFQMECGHITFFVNNCVMSIAILCKQHLKVRYKSKDFDEIELTLKLFAKRFDLHKALRSIFLRRVDEKKMTLDLSYIGNIPEVQKMLYDPTDKSHLLEQLLRYTDEMAPAIVILRLAGNELTSLTFLRVFFPIYIKNRSLRVLDLANNKISSISDMVPYYVKIKDLYLDCNPICAIYNQINYVKVVKANFPHVIKLDGIYLPYTSGLPYGKPNFIMSSSCGDPGELADQFLEHFYTLYDGLNRFCLRDLYHKDAYFSLTCMYLDGQSTSKKGSLSEYVAVSRYLMPYSMMRKENANLFHGPENIIETLSKLPLTQHDLCTFTVDVTQPWTQCTVLTVTGVFLERNTYIEGPLRHFMRTFILTSPGNNEYKIVNDIMCVTNATTRETEEAFQFMRPRIKAGKSQPLIPKMTECDKDSMAENFSQLTGMIPAWSHKCLDDSNWDVKKALEVFVELLKADKIPEAAFTKLME